MSEHNCVRNPDTGECYVCNTPMRGSFQSYTLLDAITGDSEPTQATHRAKCSECANTAVQGETLCIDHWIVSQTKPTQVTQATAKPKRTKPTASISLDSIVAAMHNKYQN